MKTCTHPNCNNPVFSKGRCKYHIQFKAPNKASKRRIKESGTYTSLCRKKRLELIKTDEWKCVFCKLELPIEYNDTRGWHHLDGREGDNYIDESKLFPAHLECHDKYHHSTQEKLHDTFWYNAFLEWLEVNFPEIRKVKEFEDQNPTK